jgi:hypothetical protein
MHINYILPEKPGITGLLWDDKKEGRIQSSRELKKIRR